MRDSKTSGRSVTTYVKDTMSSMQVVRLPEGLLSDATHRATDLHPSPIDVLSPPNPPRPDDALLFAVPKDFLSGDPPTVHGLSFFVLKQFTVDSQTEDFPPSATRRSLMSLPSGDLPGDLTSQPAATRPDVRTRRPGELIPSPVSI